MTTAPAIGIIHTSLATVDLFGRLLSARLPGARIVNLLDDSILPELAANGSDLAAVLPRWRGYARAVSERGVDIILNACSSIGELCEEVQPEIPQPIVRVDAGMARQAVRQGASIAVLATLETTLRPTSDLLARTAGEGHRASTIARTLVTGAYAALLAGDQARHDDLVASAIARATESNEVVVLAQASMARVLPRLSEAQQSKVLTSPPYATEEIAQRLTQNSPRPPAREGGHEVV